MHDVIIIGGGVIGLSTALELSTQGVSVAVLDQGPLGQESSWAGAGILPPGNPRFARTAAQRLRAASHVLWPRWSENLRELSGIDNGYRVCGGLELLPLGAASTLDGEIAQWQTEGVTVTSLTREQLIACEPQLNPEIVGGYLLPEMAQVRNPRHLKALVGACRRQRVTLLPGRAAQKFHRSGERVSAVETPEGPICGGSFVIAGGAWTGGLLSLLELPAAVRPLRGQIVLVSMAQPPFRRVLNVGARYLVPRDDGRVLIGSTEEEAGFDKRPTAGGAGELLRFGLSLVPALASATLERTWAGLRPQSADDLPCLGRAPGFKNVLVAAGHFRSGLQLSPITAVLMSQLILEKPASILLEPYRVERLISLARQPFNHG